jgi:hypothetical protein
MATPITNSDAITDAPNNYLVCTRTGFRVSVNEGLVKDGYGQWVRSRSYDPVHPQDRVRSRAETQRGSIAPEQDDRLISVLYPNDVQPSDL